MCFFMSFLPATFWAIVGYFILFSSTKTDGAVKMLGQVLAIWAFILVGMILIGGAYLTVSGACPINALMNCHG